MQKTVITFASALAWALTSCSSAPAPLPVDTRSDTLAPVVDATAIPAAAVVAPRQGDAGGGWQGSFSGLIGYRALDEDTWKDEDIDISKQVAVAAEAEFRPPESVIGFEVGGGFSGWTDSVDGIDVTGTMFEVYAGPRLTFGSDGIRPYVGAGGAWLRGDIDVEGFESESEDSFAGYAHVGVLFDMSEGVHLGVDGRATFGSDFSGDSNSDANGDYYQIALVVGTHW